MRIEIPIELVPYIRLRDGEIIMKKDIPSELKEKFEKFKLQFEDFKKSEK